MQTVTSCGREPLHSSADCPRAKPANVVVQITPPMPVAEKPFRQSTLPVHGVGASFAMVMTLAERGVHPLRGSLLTAGAGAGT